MKNHKRCARVLAVCGGGLLLAGCSYWSFEPRTPGNSLTESMNLSAVRAAAPQSPASFTQFLVADYASFAGSLADNDHDWVDADYFSRKGLASSHGVVTPPENNESWLVPLEVPVKLRSQLAEGRTRLVAALDAGGRDRAPAVAARAQVSYDCWVERMEDDWKTAADGSCHKQFLAALAQLDGRPTVQAPAAPAAAPAPAREYRVYFEFDKAALLPEAQQILQQVAGQMKQGRMRIMLIGKTDRSGSDGYNLALSHRRADAVRDALVKDGVPAGTIEERWVGEREPPVPTPDGVREPRNRLVEIILR